MASVAGSRSILVVDDEPIIRDAIRRVLERATPFQIYTACDGVPALETFRHEKIDLVITDLLMTQMNGIELLRNLKRLDPQIPVIIVTGYGSLDDAIEAIHLGVADFVKKPFDIRELIKTIERIFLERDQQELLHS